MPALYPRRVRSTLVVVPIVLILLIACTPPPDLVIGETMAGDFTAVAVELWAEFEVFAAGRLDCFGSVTIQASTTLDDRAQYEPLERTITVLVPRSIPSLRESLVHELAHHVESACPAHEEGRASMLEAMGFPAEAPWFEGDRWPETPSERFAEATVELLLGEREIAADVFLTETELQSVAQWWSGE